jgi:hypothetical protein
MTTQTLTATHFSGTVARPRRLRRSSLTMFLLTALWVTGVALVAKGPVPAEPVLLVLFGVGLLGAAGLLSRKADRATSAVRRVNADGD